MKGSVGMRINVAGCATISHGLPMKDEVVDHEDLNHTSCYLAPHINVRDKDGLDSSHIEIKSGAAFEQEFNQHYGKPHVNQVSD